MEIKLFRRTFSTLMLAVVLLAGVLPSPAAVLDPETLPQLVGLRVDDPKIQDIYKSLGSLTLRQKKKVTLYKFLDNGIQFVASSKGIIEGISLYSEGSYNFKQYQGKLPHGLTFEDTKATVIQKLGKPEEESVTLDKHRVDVFPKYQMAVSYGPGDAKESPPKIFVLYLRKDY